MKLHARISPLLPLFLAILSGCGKDETSSGGAYLPLDNGATLPEIGARDLDAEEARFLVLINEYRQRRGLPALSVSPRLTLAARWLSTDMARKNYLDHQDSLGHSPFRRMDRFRYFLNGGARGENIAGGNHDADATFLQWKNSAGHNTNMLNPRYRAIGIARAYDRGSRYDWYWTTDFGSYVDASP